jgi:hypothetical protein
MAKQNEPGTLVTERQRNVAPPDVIRNVAKFDGVLWSGKGIYSALQKIGVAVLGSFFLLSGCFYVALGLGILDESAGRKWNADLVYSITSVAVVAGLGLLIGWRLLRNALSSTKPPKTRHAQAAWRRRK